ncbi:MAG: hypothetical protein ACERKV_03975 [Clostridiaceae bacterium]
MKTYRELYFKGTEKQLSDFIDQIGSYAVGDWKLKKREGYWKDYLLFDYTGMRVNKASVSIYIGNDITKGKLRVGNIVPIEKNELSVDEYNDALLKFYNDVIKPFKQSNKELSISQPTDDIFDPTSVISKAALKKLELFCSLANKSTGSSHPLDKERWFDFICQTVDDGKMFDSSTLAMFLQDEDYWGKNPDGFIGVMGDYAWDEDHAYELASEYENSCDILIYYKKNRGI